MQSSLIPGISEQIVNEIRGVLVHHPNVVRARIFGSRAKGVYRSNSDIDIAVDGNVSPLEASIIKGDLDMASALVGNAGHLVKTDDIKVGFQKLELIAKSLLRGAE